MCTNSWTQKAGQYQQMQCFLTRRHHPDGKGRFVNVQLPNAIFDQLYHRRKVQGQTCCGMLAWWHANKMICGFT